MFTCEKYHLDMPAKTADDFCARRYRKAQEGDYCLDCDKGKNAARNNRGMEANMAMNVAVKKCIDCGEEYKPTSGVQKRCATCKAKKGAASASKAGAEKKVGKPTKGRVKQNSEEHECEGCKVLQMQLDDLATAEKIMVAAGLVTADKFEKARQIVHELHA